jgi:hypothetical protein
LTPELPEQPVAEQTLWCYTFTRVSSQAGKSSMDGQMRDWIRASIYSRVTVILPGPQSFRFSCKS